jgi:kynureninase
MRSANGFIKPDGIYLLSHSIGLMPIATDEAFSRAVLDIWRSSPESAWRQWLAEIDSFRCSLAVLLNHDQDCFCPQTNVSSSISKLIQALPFNPKKPTILLSEKAFPSVGFVFARAAQLGWKMRFVPDKLAQDNVSWSRELTSDIGVVLITHVQSEDSSLASVEEISKAARQRGIFSIVDVAQSAGVIPIDLRLWNVDAVVGSCVKWLCGGPGAGFLWINPETMSEYIPLDVGWFSHEDPFAFNIHEFRPAADARRFWGGTPSVLPFAMARHGIDAIVKIGLEVVRSHNLNLCRRLLAGLEGTPVAGPQLAERRGGTVVLASGTHLSYISRSLKSAGIAYDERAMGLRLSPHIYNTAQEVDAVLAAIANNKK